MCYIVSRKVFMKSSFFNFKSLLPKTFLKRAVLIIVLPLVLVQITSIYVFLNRHLESVTRNIASNIASSIDLVTHLHKRNSSTITTAATKLGFRMEHGPQASFQNIKPSSIHAWEDKFFARALREALKDPYHLVSTENFLRVYVLVRGETLSFTFSRKRLMSRTTPLVFFWAIGASIFFLIIAILFMKNQVRPIKELAEASELFGKGMGVVTLKPHGASEVRQAAIAFSRMQERITRQMAQRTEMLAGISHDLRTPLTRMRLALALLPKTIDIESLKRDIDHMEQMIQEYLDFVRGDQTEVLVSFSLKELISPLLQQWKRAQFEIESHIPEDLVLMGRPQSLKRALENLISNAHRFAKKAWISASEEDGNSIFIIIDDDGPGIPEKYYQDVLKPFFRLEVSRNIETGGIGLGLSIVTDIVHHHAGHLQLARSPRGGLRVMLALPK